MQSFMKTFGLYTMLVTSLTNLTKWIQHFLVMKFWSVIAGY